MSLKVLVSDDERIWREDILGDAFCQAGYTVQTASTIEETITCLCHEFYHVVTVDLSFSEDHSVREGRRTMELLKALDEGTKVIVLTGYGTVDVAVEALREFEVFHFLQKGESFDEEKVLRLVREAAGKAEIALTNRRLTLSIESVITGFRLHDVASAIHEKENDARWLVMNILCEVRPIVFSDNPGVWLTVEGDRLFQRHMWSRMLGKPLTLVFGSRVTMDKFISDRVPPIKENHTDSAKAVLLDAPELGFPDFPPLVTCTDTGQQ